MRENGFFRVELIVVMFAGLLVMFFAVPRANKLVLNIKMNSAVDSVISYKETVSNFYVSKLFLDNSFKLDGVYNISDGDLVTDNDEYEIKVYGNVPSSGYLLYQDNILKDGCVMVSGFSVTLSDGEVVSATKGNCSSYASSNDTDVAFGM